MGRERRGVEWPFDESCGALLGGREVCRAAGEEEGPSTFMALVGRMWSLCFDARVGENENWTRDCLP